jgi:hypothetical protein
MWVEKFGTLLQRTIFRLTFRQKPFFIISIPSTIMGHSTFVLEGELGWFERQKFPDILVLTASKQCIDREL